MTCPHAPDPASGHSPLHTLVSAAAHPRYYLISSLLVRPPGSLDTGHGPSAALLLVTRRHAGLSLVTRHQPGPPAGCQPVCPGGGGGPPGDKQRQLSGNNASHCGNLSIFRSTDTSPRRGVSGCRIWSAWWAWTVSPSQSSTW